MGYKQFLESFSTFSGSDHINEMASELSKLGVPKDLMKFIHKLSGEVKHLARQGWESQVDPRTGREVSTFHTRKEPSKAKGGPWPEREDIPLSHDVQVVGTKRGKKNIYYYLTDVLESRKDIGIRLILVNPNQDQVHYLTRKTGKISQKEIEERGWERGAAGREEARAAGISQKRGLYIRAVTMDADSGLAVAAWVGTIGQMAEDWDDDTVLYIMEQEDKVRTKRIERQERNTITADQFLDYFVKNYTKIADKMMHTAASKQREEFAKIAATITPEDLDAKVDQLRNLIDEIKKNKADVNSLQPKLWNFLELAAKEGEYEKDTSDWRNKADLTDMVAKHTMPVVASMFLQFVVLGRVSKDFYSDDPIKAVGLEDLFF